MSITGTTRALDDRRPHSADEELVTVEDLDVRFELRNRTVHAVRGVNYSVRQGETIAVIGESGSGKTVSARAIMGLLPPTAQVSGSVRLLGKELIGLSEKEFRQHRGPDLAMVFQDPARSLNPTMRIGQQITEAIRMHLPMDRHQARERAIELLQMVRLPSAPQRFNEYPHELSGGMRQRVMIAMALSCHPRLLIADEATTALDVTTQAQIMDLLRDLQAELHMALILISHDMGLAASFSDEVLVMYGGKVVEQSPTKELFAGVRMPYTKVLLEAIPRVESLSHAEMPVVQGRPPDMSQDIIGCSFAPRCPRAEERCFAEEPPLEEHEPNHRYACFFPVEDEDPASFHAAAEVNFAQPSATLSRTGEEALLDARNIVQEFVVKNRGGVKGGVVHAVSDVSFQIFPGETLGIVGETGSGKSTLARSIIQAPKPKSGEVHFRGSNLVQLSSKELIEARRHVQMVFQDPYSSLDPKWEVLDLVEEPMRARGIGTPQERHRRATEVLELVNMDPSIFGHRHPRQLSGGQCQRVAIARALSVSPALIICDEPVSSLDVLIQAQVLNLFEQLRKELNLSYLFIAHDLALVKQVSDRVAVMHLGKLCEVGPSQELYLHPYHPYTAALLASIPSPDPMAERTRAEETITGVEPPSPLDPPSGCRFRTRCPRAQERCALEEPMLRELSVNHTVACHFPLEEAPPIAQDVAIRGTDSGSTGQANL